MVIRRSFRRTGARWWLAACVSVFFLIGLSGVIAPTDAHGSPHPAERIFFGILAVGALWITVGVARQGIFCGSNGVVVRNVFKRYEARWSDIDAIEPPMNYGALRNAGIGFRLRDGRRINAALFSAGPLNRRAFADEVVAALRDELARQAGHRGEVTEAAREETRRAAVRTSARFWVWYGAGGSALGVAMAGFGIATGDWGLAAIGVMALLTSARLLVRWRRRAAASAKSEES